MDIYNDEYLPLRDTVFLYLRKKILTGELKPGERLLEIKLAETLGVSRTPIREAIRKLELEGLVIIVPRRGAEVANITRKSLQDVLEVRSSLEILAIELACDRANDEAISKIEEKLNAFNEALDKAEYTEICYADEAYHDAIIEAADNLRLAQLISNLREQMYRFRFEYVKDTQAHKIIREEHKAIFDGIAGRNKAVASAAMKEHIDHQEESILRVIEE